jgi:NADPH-dependent glutamate synthase beta subunit-like oxidoreductase
VFVFTNLSTKTGQHNIDIPSLKIRATANITMRVAAIGAGPAGLAMLKNLRQEGLEATAFERLPHIGGNWKFTGDPTATSVLRGKLLSRLL